MNTVYSSPAVVLLLFLSSVLFNKHCCGTVVVIPVGSSTFVGSIFVRVVHSYTN